jgi:hypothetical protein
LGSHTKDVPEQPAEEDIGLYEEVKGSWKKCVKCVLPASSSCITKCEQPKEDNMGAACGSYGKEDKLIHSFGRKPRRKGTIRKT